MQSEALLHRAQQQGDQLALATSLNSDDAKAILGVLVGDPLDKSSDGVGWFFMMAVTP